MSLFNGLNVLVLFLIWVTIFGGIYEFAHRRGQRALLERALQTCALRKDISRDELDHLREFMDDVIEHHGMFFWGVVLFRSRPNFKYYGLKFGGFQLGYWRGR